MNIFIKTSVTVFSILIGNFVLAAMTYPVETKTSVRLRTLRYAACQNATLSEYKQRVEWGDIYSHCLEKEPDYNSIVKDEASLREGMNQGCLVPSFNSAAQEVCSKNVNSGINEFLSKRKNGTSQPEDSEVVGVDYTMNLMDVGGSKIYDPERASDSTGFGR